MRPQTTYLDNYTPTNKKETNKEKNIPPSADNYAHMPKVRVT